MMKYLNSDFLKKLHTPKKDSHKGDNGRLIIIGGSHLFHGASLWALTTASRIVDMVYYASVKENQQLTSYLKKRLYSFILVPSGKEEEYLSQADAALIGPGMVRGSQNYTGTGESGKQTRQKTLHYLTSFPHKKWVIDAGALQALTPTDFTLLQQFIITPHAGEFERVFNVSLKTKTLKEIIPIVQDKAKEIGGVIVLKGKVDIIADKDIVLLNKTGNEGMTKGGTGDVLAGLIAALACTNDMFTAAAAGAYINGLAGDELYKTAGPFFNADQLVDKVPQVLWQQLSQ